MAAEDARAGADWATAGSTATRVRCLARRGRARRSSAGRSSASSPSGTGRAGSRGRTLREPDGQRRRRRRREAPDRIAFHAWVQWCFDRQLAAASERDAAHRRHAGRRRSRRLRRLGLAGAAGARRVGRRAGGPVQPCRARTGACRRSSRIGCGRRATGRSSIPSAPSCATPAACASTTSSGSSGCGGSRRA